MNTAISDKFSFKRVWTITCHYCVANARNLIISASVLFGLMILIALLITKTTGPELPDVRAGGYAVFSLFAAGIVFPVIGSLTFSSYSTKPKRISAMMLPATKAEKFISMMLVYVVFGNLVLLLSLLLSDVLSASLFGIRSAISFLPDIFYNEPEMLKFVPLFCLGILWLMLLSQAIYIIGSAMWPKLSFLKTFIFMNAFQIIMAIFIPFFSIADWFGSHFNKIFDYLYVYVDTPDKLYVVLWCVLAFAYLVILPAIYSLAWLRFRNLAVAKRFLS